MISGMLWEVILASFPQLENYGKIIILKNNNFEE